MLVQAGQAQCETLPRGLHAAALKYVDPTRPPGLASPVLAGLANTRLGRFISVHVVWKVDPWLMRASRGRIGLGLTMPTALLETRGARSGAVRRNAVITFGGIPMRATVAAKASRTIPIVQLTAT